jgi:tetrahydromethanopterin S-methyltransferase subunit G
MRRVQVPQLPRVVGGLIDDVRTIARGMQVLPELARLLDSIDAKVDTLNAEVTRMREAVEAMGGDVKTVPDRLDELQHSLSPMRRIGRRFGRGEGNGEG